MKCSVKVEKHPILKNVDPTKPILLTTLEKSVSKSFFTSEKSSQKVLKYQHFKESQASRAIKAIQPTLCVQNDKNSKKEQKVQLSVSKCVASILSKVEIIVDGSGKSRTLKTFNTELKFSKTQIDAVIASSSKCRDSVLQSAAKPRIENNSGCLKIKKSESSESLKKSSSKNKISHSHTQHKLKKDKLDMTCDNIELNTNDFVPSSVKTSRLKSNSLASANSNKGLATNSSNSSSAKLSTKSSFSHEGNNSLDLNPKLNSKSTGLRDISKPTTNKDPNLLKSKSVKKDKSSSKRVHSDLSSIKIIHNKNGSLKVNANPKNIKLTTNEQNTKIFSDNNMNLMPNNFTRNTLKNDSDVAGIVEMMNFSKLGKEVVMLKRLSEEEIAKYLKPPSCNSMIEQTSITSCNVKRKNASKISICETLSKNLSKQKMNNVSQNTKQTEMALGTKYMTDKLSSEEKTSIVSKSVPSKNASTHRFTFPKTCFESKSPITKQNVNNKQSVFSTFNNDDSDFKSSFNKYESPTKFSSKEKLSTSASLFPKSRKSSDSEGKKGKSNQHQPHNVKGSISNRKAKRSKTDSMPGTSFNKACNTEIKNVIEEQVKNSLGESLSDELPEVTIIDIKDISSDPMEIVLSSDEEEISSLNTNTAIDEENVPPCSHYHCAAFVQLYNCKEGTVKNFTPSEMRLDVCGEEYCSCPCKFKHLKSCQAKKSSLNRKIKCEKEEINGFSENMKSKPMETSNNNLLHAIKTEPVEHKELSKIEEKLNFKSTADESLLSKPILPFAVKSKPIVKTKLNFNKTSKEVCTLDNSTEQNNTNIFAVKSLPTVKTSAHKQTNLSNDVKLKNKSADANVLLSSDSCPKSKLPKKKESSIVSSTVQNETKPFEEIEDFKVASDKTTNHLPKAGVNNKNAKPSPVKITKIEENKLKPSFVSSETIMCNNKTEKSFLSLKELDLMQKNCTSEPLPILTCDAKKVTGIHKRPRKDHKNKSGFSSERNLKTSPKKKDTSIKKHTATKSAIKSNVKKSSASVCGKDSLSISQNIVTSSKVNYDSKLKDVVPKIIDSQDGVKKSDKCDLKVPVKSTPTIRKEKSKIFGENSKLLDLPSSTNILVSDGAVANEEQNSEEVLSHLKINGSKNSTIHSSNTAISVQNNSAPKDIKVNVSTDQLELNDLKTTINDVPDSVPIIENDLYDIVKRRNCNKAQLNSKIHTSVNDDKCLPTPKPSKCTRKNMSNSKSDALSFPSKKNNNVPTNSDPVATKEAIVKPKYNVVIEPELPSIDKSIVCLKDKALLNSDEKEISNQARNKANIESLSATISSSTIESQAEKNTPSARNRSASTDFAPVNNANVEPLSATIESQTVKNTPSTKNKSVSKDSAPINNADIESLSATVLPSTTDFQTVENTPSKNPIVSRGKNGKESTDKALLSSSEEEISNRTRNKSASKDSAPINNSNFESATIDSQAVMNTPSTRNKSASKDSAPINNATIESLSATIESQTVKNTSSTMNKSASNDSSPINNGNIESLSATILPSTIEYQTVENIPSKNPISLVSRGKKGKNGKESNNFGFFSSKNSKRRRNSPEIPVLPKPMSKKLSLKNKSTRTAKVKNSSPLQPTNKRKWKIDKDLLKSTPQAAVDHSEECLSPENIIVKEEPFVKGDVAAQNSDMKDALSRFDFDECASIEPTSCMSYSSKRSRKNCQTNSDSKAPAGKLVSQEAKSMKSSKKLKKHSASSRKETKRSSRLNSSTFEKIEERHASNQVDNLNFKLVQQSPKLKLKRDSCGKISVVPAITTSISESIPVSSTSQGKDNKNGLEEKHSLKMKIFKNSSTQNSETKELQCIMLSSDSESEAEKPVKTTRKRERLSRKRSELVTNPCEPLVPPILIKNIKKEKIDDYEQQPYVVPKLIQSVTEYDSSQLIVPKCEPIKLYRNADNFSINPAVSNPENEIKPKRSRGRPRKVSKDASPVKNETLLSNEKVPILRIPKRSATVALESEEINSTKPRSRKTRSNSARASTSLHWSEVKIKQEPISDEEYVAPPSTTSELPTSSIKSRRRNSLKCENFKKFFDTDSGDSDDSKPKIIKSSSPRKKKLSGGTTGNSNTNSPTKSPGRRTSATNNFCQFFESNKNEDSDECQVVFSTLPKKTNSSRKRRRNSSSNRQRRNSSPKKRRSSEHSVIPDTANSNLFECRVNVQRLLQSEIEKHSSESHAVNKNEEERKTATQASVSSNDTRLLKSAIEESEMPSLEMETRSNKIVNMKPNEENHKHNSLSLKSNGRESSLIGTLPENALIKLIPDASFGSFRKLTSVPLENTTETLHENAMKECNYLLSSAPPANVNTVAQLENLQSSEIVSHANVSTPEMEMKENVIERVKEQSIVNSSIVGLRKDLSPGSKIFAQGRGNFPHEWDSPQDITIENDIINSCVADSSPLEVHHVNHSNESPEVNCSNIEKSKQDNVNIASISGMNASKTPVPRKARNVKGNLFDKVSEEMVKHTEGIFDSTKPKKCFSGDNPISTDQQPSLPFHAPAELVKFDIPYSKATPDIQQPFKSLRGEFERRQDNQTVSCFKGYDLLSETGIMPLASSQKGSRNMFEIPTQEIMDYDSSCSPVPKKSQPSYIQQSNNKHNSIYPDKPSSMHNSNYPGMQLDNNPYYFPNSYSETDRLLPTFSMQQNKYAKPNMHENQNTNDSFDGAGWPKVGTSFCSNEGLTQGQSSDNPLKIQKSEDPFKNNPHQLSNHDYFHKQQFGNTNISHLPNYFSPEETKSLWSPIEQAKSDGSFVKSTEMFLNEYSSSSNDHYSTGMSSPVPSLPHLTFPRTPVSNYSVQKDHTAHLPAFQSSKEKSNSVEGFDTNSLSPMSSSPKVFGVVNESDDVMSPYHASKKSPSKLSNDDDAEKAMKSLSDVLAGSPLDMENDSVPINCDAFSTSVEDTVPKNVSLSQISTSQNFFKNETLTSTASDMKISPVNKYEDSELSQLNLANSFPTLDFTCLTENDIDHNLLDFEEIACNNSTSQTNITASSANIETKPKNNAASDIKETKLLLAETLSNTSTAIDASIPYEVPFQDNIIPLVNQPDEECFPQLSIPSFSSVNQTFLPTLMVGESVVVPQSNIFLNDASIIINRDSSSQDFVDILPNSSSVADNSVSAVSGSEPSSGQEVDNFKQSFNQGEDILSMIVKSCDIGEEFDENLCSPAEDINESLPNGVNDSAELDSMIHSFYGDDTLYGLNQTNTQTFCSDLQNLNETSESTTIPGLKESLEKKHIDNAISSSQLNVLPPSKMSTPESKLVTRTGIEGNSCGSSINEAKKTVVPLPKMQNNSIFTHKANTSNNDLVLHQKPKKRKRVHEVDSNSCQTFPRDSRDSTYEKTCDNQEKSYCVSSNLNANSQQKGKVQVSFNTNHTNSNFVSGDNLESTPSASRQENRNFLSEELGVSPINKDNLLTSGTKKKRRLLFDRKTVPLDKNSKKPDKDIAAGGFKRFWENSLLTDHGLVCT